MNKREEKRVQSLISVSKRVSANVLKVDKKMLHDNTRFEDMLLLANKQNEVIDLCASHKKTVSETADILLRKELCTDLNHAIKRIKRHKKADLNHYIATRMHKFTTLDNAEKRLKELSQE